VALALILVVCAAALAVAFGGTLSRLSELTLRARWLVVVAVLAQLAGGVLAIETNDHGFYPTGLAVSALAALAFCARNARIAGVPLVTLGLLGNALVVTLNGAMPVSEFAAARAGVPIASIAAGGDARHSIADPGTTARWLGDVVPVPLPWHPEVVSPGDALIAAGLGELVLLGMGPRRRRTGRSSSGSSSDSSPREPTAVALS
jgi:hypothetical protein